MKKVLAFFGAFNPPTLAHVMMAQKALLETGRESVVFVPSRMSYIAGEQGKDYAFEDNLRLDMLRKICEVRSWMEVSDLELKADHQPRTYETLCMLRRQGYDPALLCGADKLAEMETEWKYVDRIAVECGIVCMERSGDNVRELLKESSFLKSLAEYITVVETTDAFRSISSSKVRRLLLDIRERKQELAGLVPDEILNMLLKENLK